MGFMVVLGSAWIVLIGIQTGVHTFVKLLGWSINDGCQ